MGRMHSGIGIWLLGLGGSLSDRAPISGERWKPSIKVWAVQAGRAENPQGGTMLGIIVPPACIKFRAPGMRAGGVDATASKRRGLITLFAACR